MSEKQYSLDDEALEKANGGADGRAFATDILFKTCVHCQSKIMVNEIPAHMHMVHAIENPVAGSDYV